MSSVQLLDKTRKINRLLHNNSSQKVVFNDICKVMSEILSSDVLVVSRIKELVQDKIGGFVDGMFNERMLNVLSTKENVNLETLGFAEGYTKKYHAIITPIDVAGERFGTLFIYKSDSQYEIDDIILCEYGATVVGLEMLRSSTEEQADLIRKEQVTKSAISTLTNTEIDAIKHVFSELKMGEEQIIVTSRIADQQGVTRSIIVNALKKLESAGVIDAKIKVLNDMIFDELANYNFK